MCQYLNTYVLIYELRYKYVLIHIYTLWVPVISLDSTATQDCMQYNSNKWEYINLHLIPSRVHLYNIYFYDFLTNHHQRLKPVFPDNAGLGCRLLSQTYSDINEMYKVETPCSCNFFDSTMSITIDNEHITHSSKTGIITLATQMSPHLHMFELR